MSGARLRSLIQAASAQGILPSDASPSATARPWSIVLLSALGAWIVAVALFLVVALLFWEALHRGPWCYVLAICAVTIAMFALRAAPDKDFVEHFSLPALLVGLGLLAFGLYRDVDIAFANAVLTLLLLGIGGALRRNWLRMVLGALACMTFMLMTGGVQLIRYLSVWNATSFAVLAWLAAMLCIDHCVPSKDNAGKLLACESLSTGWILATLGMLVYGVGSTFLSAALLGFQHNMDGGIPLLIDSLPRAASCALTLVAMAWLIHRWPALRTMSYLAATVMLVVMAWLIPALGVSLLALSYCASSGRWQQALASGGAAAWIIGSFYYQLDLALATKALIMLGMGAAFGIIAWRNWIVHPFNIAATSAPLASAGAGNGHSQHRGIAASLLFTLLVTLLAANFMIWQKETLISNGRQVFIELEPVDPRSLMQGDYMELNFKLPALEKWRFVRRASVIAKVNEQGVTVVLDLAAADKPLAGDEIVIELVSSGTGLKPATDAWYFKEGEAERWSRARYGEFRIDEKGRALLVNLRGPRLEAL